MRKIILFFVAILLVSVFAPISEARWITKDGVCSRNGKNRTLSPEDGGKSALRLGLIDAVSTGIHFNRTSETGQNHVRLESVSAFF